jgi:hypothetical protein
MSKFATRLLALAIGTTALVVVPMATSVKAETSSSRHIKKRKTQKRPGFSNPWSAGQSWPVTKPSSPAREVCPGIARGFECAGPWPPPMYDDPDRKVSGSDGG